MSRGRRRRTGSPAGSAPAKSRRYVALALVLALVDCRQRMAVQPKYDPLEPSDFFADGMSARPRIPGTVARGEVGMVGYVATGKINGQDGDGFPFPVTMQVMNRGQGRCKILCSECPGMV